MEVIVMKIKRKEGSSVVAGLIRPGVSPLASNGLNEAFGLAVRLRAIRFGEVVFDAEAFAGGGEELGAISRTAIGQHALDLDTMIGVEADRWRVRKLEARNVSALQGILREGLHSM